jgi:Zn-dependent protease
MMALLPGILLAIVLGATAIIFHEVAHGYAALAFGDETALREGRLSLNPIRHVDRVGTLLLPALLIVGQLLTVGRVLFMFGWAKPVPVDARNFRFPRQMMALVALAGPAMNFALAFLAAHLFLIQGLSPILHGAIEQFIVFNLVLGLFNLVPVPPLDGGRIIVGVLPLRLAAIWARAEPFGIVAVLLLIAVPSLLRQAGIAFDPLGATLGPVLDWAFSLVLRLAGVQDAGP